MKKIVNTGKLWSIARVFAIFLMLGLAATACSSPGSNSGGIPVTIRATNNNGIAPSLAIIARSLSEIGTVSDGKIIDAYSSFYDSSNLGTSGMAITPTTFNIGMSVRVFLSNGYVEDLDGGLFNFARPSGVSINVGNIPAVDVTVEAIAINLFFSPFFIGSSGSLNPQVQFPWPNSDSAFQYSYINGNFGSLSPNLVSGTARASLVDISPNGGHTASTRAKNVGTILYHGDTRRLLTGTVNASDFTTITNNNVVITVDTFDTLVIPFTPITISPNTSFVTFNVSWNLNGIISHYYGLINTGQDTTDDFDDFSKIPDDIFVLKDGWWNDLYITTSVQ